MTLQIPVIISITRATTSARRRLVAIIPLPVARVTTAKITETHQEKTRHVHVETNNGFCVYRYRRWPLVCRRENVRRPPYECRGWNSRFLPGSSRDDHWYGPHARGSWP